MSRHVRYFAAVTTMLVLSACGQVAGEPPSTTSEEPSASLTDVPEETTTIEEVPTQPEEQWGEQELAVITAIDFDPAPKAVHFEPARNAFIITIYTVGETFSDERLGAIQTAAEEVAEGKAVIIELTDEDPPVLNN